MRATARESPAPAGARWREQRCFHSGEHRRSGMAAGRRSHCCVDEYHRNRTTHDLRRLRLRGLVERVPRTNRHLVTADGLRVALCYHRLHARVLRPAMSAAFDTAPNASSQIRRAVDAFGREIIRLSQGIPGCKSQAAQRRTGTARSHPKGGPHATAVSNDSASLCARFALLACLWTLDPQSIHRDFNGVLLVLVERGYIADVRHEAVDAGATEAFAQEFLKEVQVLVLAIWHDRH